MISGGIRMQGCKSTIAIVIAISVVLIMVAGLPYAYALSKNEAISLNPLKTAQSLKKINIHLLKWKKIIVQKGDSLATIFTRLEVKQHDLLQIVKQHKLLATLHPHQILYFQIKLPHQLIILKYPLSTVKTSVIIREGNHFTKKISRNPVLTTLVYKTFAIYHYCNRDAKKAELTARVLYELRTIFRGKADFSHNLRQSDRLSLIYQEKRVDGKKCYNGGIVAVEFIHQGKVNQVVRYTYPMQHTVYYTTDGQGVEARFLHTPLHYKRISSHFSYHRFDPVLHRIHPHLGIDFAANIETPIRSIGEGNVIFIGKDGGYGKTVKIEYGRHYVALYGHMSRFEKIKLHELVRKGQIIGYVGKSGWATGPHLHFGFYVDGRPRDWLAMKPPIDQSVPHNYEKSFLATVKQLFTELHLHQDVRLATNKFISHTQ